MIIAMSTGFASASFAFGEGGGETCYSECPEEPPTKVKANNGWGNGGDPTNAGSGSGGTRDTKLNSDLR
jgi:hypothetical protein